MPNFYITAVRYGLLSIEKVPSSYQSEVREALGLSEEVTEEF
ncbi:hypothetical protein [Bacillus sp. ISL-57]|nr:hypothetical protein [Bacillus sp. ISL-57]